MSNGPQYIILKEGSSESKGREAQRNNMQAAKIIAEIVKTSLGPRGMDKMLVDSLGDVTITNDGATMLKEIDVQHPAAKMMVEISKATDNEVGDGTTSAVILAGALLEKAEELINQDVHPTVVVDGYMKALEKAEQVLEKIAEKVDPTSRADLIRVATTSMQTKLVSDDAPFLAGLVVDAVSQVAEKQEDGTYRVDIDNVKVEKKPGGSMLDTKLISGVALDKEVVHSAMPKKIEGAKIALINSPLEIEKTEFSAEIRINDPDQMQQFLDEENNILKGMVQKVVDSGANVLVCQKGIDDSAQHYLARAGVMAVRRVKESDMTKLQKATGARIVTNLDDLSAKDLGHAEDRRGEEGRGRQVGLHRGSEEPEGSDPAHPRRLAEGGRRGGEVDARRDNGHEGRNREAGHRRGRRSARGRDILPSKRMGTEADGPRAARSAQVRRGRSRR